MRMLELCKSLHFASIYIGMKCIISRDVHEDNYIGNS